MAHINHETHFPLEAYGLSSDSIGGENSSTVGQNHGSSSSCTSADQNPGDRCHAGSTNQGPNRSPISTLYNWNLLTEDYKRTFAQPLGVLEKLQQILSCSSDLPNQQVEELKNLMKDGESKLKPFATSTRKPGNAQVALLQKWGLESEVMLKNIHNLEAERNSSQNPNLSWKIRDSKADSTGWSGQSLKCCKLRVKQVNSCEEYHTRRYVIEADSEEWKSKETRMIMLVGMTGAGKTSLINQIVNFIYGVEFEDDFRFSLIDQIDEQEDRDDQNVFLAKSLTSWVSGYELQWQPGFRCPWNVFLVDTPGFGDDRGLKRDEEIVTQIQSFFEDESICISNDVASVGLVVRSAANRLTAENEYALNEVQNLFAKNLAQNISVLFTFSDSDDPPALAALRENNTQFNGFFCVNNVCLFSDPLFNISSIIWKMSFNSLQNYFEHIDSIEPTDLESTRQVLQNRQMLKVRLEYLQNRIGETITYLRSIERMLDFLAKLKKEDIDNKNCKIMYRKDEKVAVPINHYVMNCKICKQTCHATCRAPIRFVCPAFNWNGTCRNCDAKCAMRSHVREKKTFVSVASERKESLDEVAKAFDLLESPDQYSGKQLLQGLILKYRKGMREALYALQKTVDQSRELEKLALRNVSINKSGYLSNLIAQYQQSNDPEKKEHVRLLEDLLAKADLYEEIQGTPNPRINSLTVYEQKVMEKLWEYYGLNDWQMVSEEGDIGTARGRSYTVSD